MEQNLIVALKIAVFATIFVTLSSVAMPRQKARATCYSEQFPRIRGDHSSLKIYWSKPLFLIQKNIQTRLQSNARYFYLHRNKKVVENHAT